MVRSLKRRRAIEKQALETYKDAMVASGVTTTRPQDNDTFTRLTRNDEHGLAETRRAQRCAADLYRQQDLNVTLEHDYWGLRYGVTPI